MSSLRKTGPVSSATSRTVATPSRCAASARVSHRARDASARLWPTVCPTNISFRLVTTSTSEDATPLPYRTSKGVAFTTESMFRRRIVEEPTGRSASPPPAIPHPLEYEQPRRSCYCSRIAKDTVRPRGLAV